LRPDEVIIHLRPRRLAALLDDRLTTAIPDPGNDEPTLPLSRPVHLRRAGKEVRMVIDHTDPFAPPPKPDRALIRLVIRAHRFHDLLVKHKGGKFGDLAKSERLNRSYFSQLLRLAYLDPDITTAILDGGSSARCDCSSKTSINKGSGRSSVFTAMGPVLVGSHSRAERFMRCYRTLSTSARSRTKAPAIPGSTRQFSIARPGTACSTSSVTEPQSNEDGLLALAAH
jgi:hypothetical protein